MRNTPLLIQLYLVYFGFSMAGFGLSGFAYGQHLAIRSRSRPRHAPLDALHDGHSAAGHNTGIPPLTNQSIAIIKDTSRVAAIAVMEIIKITEVWVETTASIYDVFLVAGADLFDADLDRRIGR